MRDPGGKEKIGTLPRENNKVSQQITRGKHEIFLLTKIKSRSGEGVPKAMVDSQVHSLHESIFRIPVLVKVICQGCSDPLKKAILDIASDLVIISVLK